DQPGSPNSRLRDAFAQLLAMGNNQAAPAEAVWAAQGPKQFAQPYAGPETMDRVGAFDDPTTRTPMRQFDPNPVLDFPQAPAGPIKLDNPRKGEAPRPPEEPPFHGKGVVAETTDRPWELPKKKSKKKGKS